MRKLAALAFLAVAGALPAFAATPRRRRRSCSSERPTAASSSPTGLRPAPRPSAPGRSSARIRPPSASARSTSRPKPTSSASASQRSIDSQRARRRRSAAHAPGLPPARARPLVGDGAQDGVSYGYAGGGGWATPFRASRHPGPRVGDAGIMDPTGTRRADARATRPRAAPQRISMRPEVVDVGVRRPGDEQVAERREERSRRRCGRGDRGRSGRRPRARASVSGVTKAPALLSTPSMPSVSAASAQTLGLALQRQRAAEQNSLARPPRPPLLLAPSPSSRRPRGRRRAARTAGRGARSGAPAPRAPCRPRAIRLRSRR